MLAGFLPVVAGRAYAARVTARRQYGTPVPGRITLALNAIGAEGPWVDEALGGAEPMVDQWERGELLPTDGQLEALAEMTGQRPEWFCRPLDELSDPVRMFICDRSRRGENGLTIIESHVDWSGVLHVRQLTPDRPPKRVRKAQPVAPSSPTPARPARAGRHALEPDPGAPGCCTCGLPVGNFRHR
jgi:hypothetical protein